MVGRDYVTCGASQGITGLSRPDEKGVWRGFDVDVCRAFAAALLGDAKKIRFIPLNAAQRLPAVQTGEIDVLSRTTTVTFTRDMAIRFVAVTQFDTDVLIFRRALGAATPKDLDGRTVCLQSGGSSADNTLTRVETDEKIHFERVYFDSTITARDAYFSGRCDVYVTDGFLGASQVATVARNPAEHTLLYLDHLLPQGVAISRGDDRWFDVVRWTVNLLIWAEQNGVTQANVDEQRRSGPADVRRVLGGDPAFGRAIGLDADWAYQVIKQVGNYGDIWDRNLGPATRIKADRRLNKPYKEGGLQFPFPWDV
ncbi:transporter substrate-binding domain-containing protein [uncultured Phenylobacterium sp.]|uniref:transporter substrate-binding domain-containing protein n=1 Tax=uncultured Phenylobacterium sp. TaxID=349273 RepID=UPI0025E7BC5A|nr:transporter substrate-binding domain-containing protein [uncultured Phenylobacterium sp.]